MSPGALRTKPGLLTSNRIDDGKGRTGLTHIITTPADLCPCKCGRNALYDSFATTASCVGAWIFDVPPFWFREVQTAPDGLAALGLGGHVRRVQIC